MDTPENIQTLKANERIVVGTNQRGNHAGGLARQAYEVWGLLPGISEGLVGQCYGFPTLNENYCQESTEDLEQSRDRFYKTALANPELTFLLTKIGTGIAGFDENEMKKLFKDAPSNVVKPLGWK